MVSPRAFCYVSGCRCQSAAVATAMAPGKRTFFASWGRNLSGQLGTLVADASEKPMRHQPPQQLVAQPMLHVPDRIAQISAGDGFTVFVTLRGEVMACGSNESGELGEGIGPHGPVPIGRLAFIGRCWR